MAERRRTSDLLHSTKCRACHAKATGDKGTPGRTSDPLQEHQVPRLPRKSHRQRGVHPTPCTALSAAPATQKPPETKGRQGVDPTPCRAPSAAPATQKPPAEQRRTRDARAYTRPLAEHQVPRLPRKSHRQAAETKGRQGVHPTPCRAPSAAPATQKPPAERRRPRDARAYIRPLAEHQLPRLPRKSHRQSGGDQGTPGRTSNPLQSTKCRACHAKATGRAAETKGRQGVHPTPCRAPSAAPATQKPPETKGRQGVHRTPCRAPSAAPATQQPPAERRRPRDARAYIRPLAEHQVPRLPRKSHRQSGGDQGTPGRTSDPLQSTKCIYLSISLSLYVFIYLSVYQTCQGDGKAEIEWSEPSISNLPGRREHAACRPKMPAKKGRATNGVSHVYQTCQADVKTCHLRAKNAHLNKGGLRTQKQNDSKQI